MPGLENSLLDGEKIIFRTKKHFIIFLMPVLFTIFCIYFEQYMLSNSLLQPLKWVPVLVALVFLAQASLEYYFSDFAVTNKRVMLREGFFNRHANEIRLTAVSQVNVYQGPVGQILNYGSIVINAFGADDIFSTINRANEFKRAVNQQLDNTSRASS